MKSRRYFFLGTLLRHKSHNHASLILLVEFLFIACTPLAGFCQLPECMCRMPPLLLCLPPLLSSSIYTSPSTLCRCLYTSLLNTRNTTHYTLFHFPLEMAGDCGSTCPVPGGFYSYRPSIGGNTTFIAIYTLLILATTFLGWRFGKPGYSVLLGTSHLLQMLAFVGRVLLHRARDSQPYFLIFMLGTLLAPLFAASTILVALPSILAVDARQSSRSCMLALISQIAMMGLVVSGLGLEVAGAVLLCYGQRVLQVSFASPYVLQD